MAIKSYICDECFEEVEAKNIIKYSGFDLCDECNDKYKKIYFEQDKKIQIEIKRLYKDMAKNFPNIYQKWETPKRIYKYEEEI